METLRIGGMLFVKKIMFTGGGSAGHVTVNLALMPKFAGRGWSIVYVGSETGIERQLVEAKQVRYIGIQTGKLRRYFDLKNLSDPLRVLKGTFQALQWVRKEKPAVLFSKGGFVSVPVVVGAWLNRVPVVIHESDLTPGLANQISIRFAHTICTTFEESEKYLPKGKTHYVGPVIRDELNHGNALEGRLFCRFSSQKPILLIMGGSLGARRINETIQEGLPQILERFQVVHICGKGNVNPALQQKGYLALEYVNEELPNLLAAADVVVSRAGSNSIFELLHLRKPMLLIPLPKSQSRGDQILNAQSFERSGYAKVLPEETMTVETLLESIDDVYTRRDAFKAAMEARPKRDALDEAMRVIESVAKVADG